MSDIFFTSDLHFFHITGERANFNSGAPICIVAHGEDNVVALRNSGLGFVVYCKESK